VNFALSSFSISMLCSLNFSKLSYYLASVFYGISKDCGITPLTLSIFISSPILSFSIILLNFLLIADNFEYLLYNLVASFSFNSFLTLEVILSTSFDFLSMGSSYSLFSSKSDFASFLENLGIDPGGRFFIISDFS
jgi:hypothetical protein